MRRVGSFDVLVAVHIFLRRLIRRVRGVESEVEIERFARALLADVFHGVFAEELGRVTFFVDRFVVAEPVEHAGVVVREIIQFANERAVLVIEAALPGPILQVGVAEMPLADDGRVVPGVLKALRHEPFVGGQAVIAGPGMTIVCNP